MRISQSAGFSISSTRVSAAEMTAELLIEPDRIMVRGSRSAGPPRPIPVTHCWEILCCDPGLGVEQLLARLVARLAPRADAITALTRRLRAEEGRVAGAHVEIVRKYHHPDGQDHRADAAPELRDPPDLLGWWLEPEVLGFLHATGATLGVDEYDYSPDAEDPDQL